MAKAKELELSIRIAGRLDKSLTQAIKNANLQVAGLNTSIKNMSKVGVAGLGAMAGAVAGVTASLATATKTAMSFETASAGWAKVIEGMRDKNGKLTASYREMKRELKDLAMDVPATYEQLSEVAAVFGQSGIQKPEIASYTSRAVKMAVAYEQENGEAAKNIATWKQAFGMSEGDITNLGDQLNYLANHTNASEKQLAGVVTRIGSLGEMANVNPSALAAMADVLVATGVDDETTATGLRNMMLKWTAGGAATKSERNAMAQLGLDPEAFAGWMQQDSLGAIWEFFGRVNQVPQESRLALLSTYFGKRAVEPAAKLAKNMSMLQQNLAWMADSSLWAGSMEAEFASRSDTAENAKILASNAWRNVGDTIGTAFLPVVKQGAAELVVFAREMEERAPTLERIAESLANLAQRGIRAVSDALAAALPLIDRLLDKLEKDPGSITRTVGAMAAGLGAMALAPTALQMASGITGILGHGAGALAGKRGLLAKAQVLGEGAKHGAAMGRFITGNGKMRGLAGGLFGAASGMWAAGNNMGGLLSGSKKGKRGFTSRVLGLLTGESGPLKWASNVRNIPQNALAAMIAAANPAGTGVATLGNVLGAGLGAVFGKGGLNLGAPFAMLGKGFLKLMATFGPAIMGMGTLIGLVSLLWSNLDGVRSVVENLFGESGAALFDGFVNGIEKAAELMRYAFSPEGLAQIQTNIGAVFGPGAAQVFGSCIPLISAIAGVFGQIVDLGVNYIQPMLKQVFGWLAETALPAVMPLLATLVNLVGTTLVNAFKALLPVIETLLPIAESVIGGIVGLIQSVATMAVKTVNVIIRALNCLPKITVPDWVPVIGGKGFGGFNFKEVELPKFANGGFTRGPSIAGEAGVEAVISFARNARRQNIDTWRTAGRMLGATNEERMPQVVFAPNVTINGNADPETVEREMGKLYRMFVAFMERWKREQRRKGYA